MAQQTTLRDLAKAYAKGAIDHSAYRKSRNDFIEKVTAGDIKLPVIDYPPPIQPTADGHNEITERKATKRALPKAPQNVSPSPGPAKPVQTDPPRRMGLFLFGGMAVIIFVAGILFLFLDGGDAPETQAVKSMTVPAETEAHKLIRSFLKKPSWTVDNMDAFLAEWEALTGEDKASIKGDIVFGQLTNAIYKKLLEERALSGIGDGEKSLEKQTRLVHFADVIGIDDPRITMPENTSEPAGEMDVENGMEPASEDTTGAISAAAENNTVQSTPTSCRTALLNTGNPYCRDLIRGINQTAPTMVTIPPGTFMMGGDGQNRQPKHKVTINYPFAMSVHEITYGEYSSFCEAARQGCPPQPWLGDDYPVVNITWHEARAYTQWLTEHTGNAYRLPSEAEWEYAARAGKDTVYPSGDQLTHQDAVFSGEKTLNAPLPKTDRSVKRNGFRLYHMIGNVREWTLDTWHDNGEPMASRNGKPYLEGDQDYKVIRGGAYHNSKNALRVAARERLETKTADRYTGFRVVQDLAES